MFLTYLELVQWVLAHRAEIVERIQALLNAQRKPIEYLQDGQRLSRHFEDCFYIGVTESQSRLRRRLEEAHWADGFRPREIPGLHNGLVDPAELMVRGFYLWQQTRWPGRNGRVRYAHTLFNLYMIRALELLSMRVWDEGSSSAGERLSAVQSVLDQLWKSTPPDQPALVRDARWLIPLAQSPATDDLGAYFDVARHIAESFSTEVRLGIHKAGVCMAAGHLRSQIRYHSMKKGVSLDEHSVVMNTRTTNALDFALLIQDLVPLLEAYDDACQRDDRHTRLELANAICQGISPDPELFLNRVELLSAYSMIQHLYVTSDGDAGAAYTPMGARHLQCTSEYDACIGRVVNALFEDCANFRPVAGGYSPYGALYGFSTDLLEHMALRTLQPDAVTRFGLEDVFTSGDAEKRAWVSGWRKLTHLKPEVAKLFDYPQQFAEDVFERLEQALRRRVSGNPNADVRTGRLVILRDDHPQADVAHRAVAYDQQQLLNDRREGRCLLSYETPSGWVAITKGVLTDTLEAGRDLMIVGLPPAAAESLKLMCPRLVQNLADLA